MFTKLNFENMNRVFLILLGLNILQCSNSFAQSNSIFDFLLEVGEDTCTASYISNIDSIEYSDVYEGYVVAKHKLCYDSISGGITWVECYSDSSFISRTTKYLVDRIVRDTALQYMPDLMTIFLYNSEYDQEIIIDGVKYMVAQFWSKDAIEIASLYAYNQYLKTHDEYYKMLYFYYGMYNYIVSGKTYDIKNFINLESIENTSEESVFYRQFRESIDTLSNYQLARMTNIQRKKLEDILVCGIEVGDTRCRSLYTFLQLIKLNLLETLYSPKLTAALINHRSFQITETQEY